MKQNVKHTGHDLTVKQETQTETETRNGDLDKRENKDGVLTDRGMKTNYRDSAQGPDRGKTPKQDTGRVTSTEKERQKRQEPRTITKLRSTRKY